MFMPTMKDIQEGLEHEDIEVVERVGVIAYISRGRLYGDDV